MQFIQQDIQGDKTPRDRNHHRRHKGIENYILTRELKTGKGVSRQRRNHDYPRNYSEGIEYAVNKIAAKPALLPGNNIIFPMRLSGE